MLPYLGEWRLGHLKTVADEVTRQWACGVVLWIVVGQWPTDDVACGGLVGGGRQGWADMLWTINDGRLEGGGDEFHRNPSVTSFLDNLLVK
ncbi:hypothetical protein L6452_25282 [Arctium lappa]|uniref:Uncharacterized protein n=1 Tax=Arctium lappa TaxID=4217 RepID=A0ACB9AAQ6_ARCLA|nr:hypothetical protein L6452_25282 [Arctium lappa]